MEILKTFINIPSHTACERRERDIAEFMIKLFEKEGIECYLQPIDNDRGNVIARIGGGKGGKSLMLNGHMDTVPVFGMEDPFGADIREGYLFGRGACDMKSGLAAMVYAMILLHRIDVQLEGDLFVAGVIDEEAAKSTGSRYIAEKGPITDFAIVGEPTCLSAVIAHKGIDYFEIEFTGKGAHSSNPKNGINAIYAATDFVSYIRDVFVPEYETLVHPLVGAPTINVGLITGSAEINKNYLLGKSETFAGVVPDSATVYVDVRWTPNQSVEMILEQLKVAANTVITKTPGINIEVRYIPLPRPAMEIKKDEILTRSLVNNIEAVINEPATVEGVSYFADTGILYGVGGIKSIVFGPGDIADAHSVGEKVELEQYYNAVKIYAMTAMEVCQVK